MQLYDKIFAGVRMAALAKLVAQVLSWAGIVYTVRQLDSHDFGTFGLATVILSYAAMVFEGGVLEALIQRAPNSHQERRSLFTILPMAGVVLALAMFAIASPVSRWFGDRAVSDVLAALAITLVFTALSVLPLAKLVREMNFKLLALISSVQAVAATGTTVTLAYRGYGVWALACGAIVSAGVRALLLNLNSNCWERPTWRLKPAFGYTRFAGTLMLDNVLFRWYTTVDTLFLGRWAGAGTLGFYALAQDMANLPLDKVANVVNDVSLPAYAELRDDRRKATHLMLETVRTHATMGFPLFWGIAAIAGPAVLVLFGAKWTAAIVPLTALAFVAPLRLMGSIETPLLTGLGRPDVLLKTKLVLAPCMTAALAFGCWEGGLLGASLAWATVFPLCYVLCFRWALSQIQMPFAAVLKMVRGPCVAAALMAAAVMACDMLLEAREVLPAVRLMAGIAQGVVAYAALLWTIDRPAFELLRDRTMRLAGLSAPNRVAIDREG